MKAQFEEENKSFIMDSAWHKSRKLQRIDYFYEICFYIN